MIAVPDILKARILIVDEQPANICQLEQMLRGAGYVAISTMCDPHEVCEMHRDNRYSLILLDFQMPGLDGLQVLEGLKALEIDCHLPVLVITSRPDQKLRAQEAGAKNFIGKPFDRAEVLMKVHNLLELRLLSLETMMLKEQAEERFIEAQKTEMIGQLAGGVAHDFNNILSGIMGRKGLSLSEFAPEISPPKHAGEIQRAAERAARLTRQLLAFGRTQKVPSAALDLHDVVKDMGKMLRQLIDENIEITIVRGEQSGRVKADYGHVGQLLLNLVVNARDAMPHGGRLRIAIDAVTLDDGCARTNIAALAGNYVALSVTDTGTGMTDKVKAHLIEAFLTTKTRDQGADMGLAICQTIVQQSGGHIGFCSELGKGTTIKIYFPRVEQPIGAARLGRTGPWPRGSETLLVVEDDASVRDLAQHVLNSQGYEVLTALNGQDALQVVREHKGEPIRLVFTDVVMPLMGGKAMAEWLRTTHPGLKILFTSGYMDKIAGRFGVLGAGAEFLPKPYTPATLSSKVREMLDQPDDPDPAMRMVRFPAQESLMELT
jgi:two-component system, cell cycle sensor histidine kinase and response regulator CckA